MSKNGKLLIVDDEKDITEVLAETLSEIVAEIHCACNGQEALEKVSQHRFDAILSDLNMPVMPGMDFLRNLRKAGNLTPFVVLTGHGEKKAAIEALKLSAYDFLDKPWDDAELMAIIAKAIELGQQYNLWSQEEDLINDLEGMKSKNADKAILRMKYLMGQKRE